MRRILTIRNLSIEFYDHDLPETVVEDFNLTIEEGEIVGLVGESGSGKSMTALAVAGLLRRHDLKKQGEILFDGINLLDCPRAKLREYQGNRLSMIFQEPMTSLNPVQRIGRQVEESLKLHTKLEKKERRERALAMLHRVGLKDVERVYRMYPHQLSGGMRQRVMIAAAMVLEPWLLIADEPTTALDVTIQAQIVDLLRHLNREHKTAILFISHDLSLIRQLCSKVVVMQNGSIVEAGEVDRIFSDPSEAYTKALIAAIPPSVQRSTRKGEHNGA